MNDKINQAKELLMRDKKLSISKIMNNLKCNCDVAYKIMVHFLDKKMIEDSGKGVFIFVEDNQVENVAKEEDNPKCKTAIKDNSEESPSKIQFDSLYNDTTVKSVEVAFEEEEITKFSEELSDEDISVLTYIKNNPNASVDELIEKFSYMVYANVFSLSDKSLIIMNADSYICVLSDKDFKLLLDKRKK